MPSSSSRSRTRIPLFRSFSASAANSNNPDKDDGSASASDTAESPRDSLGFRLPTLSSLANLHRRGRTKSNAKRKSLESRWKSGSVSRDVDAQHQQQQQRGAELRPQVKPTPAESPNNSLEPPPTAASNSSASPSLSSVPALPTGLFPEAQATPSPAATIHSTTPITTPTPDPTPTTSAACADSNNFHPLTRHSATTVSSAAASPKTTPVDLDDKPPPLLVVQRPSTPTVPTLPRFAENSHESLPAMQRKIWVKRPGASPTRVEVAEDDLVDNVRDVILRKYANSLGRSIDAPDITLKILSRELGNKNAGSERVLGPEESIGETLNAYYPGGQTIDEALLIEVPSRRTPRASPRAGNQQISYFYSDQYRPDDAAREYFPPMPGPVHSPHLAHAQHQNNLPHAMSILTTGQPPLIPSPGSHSTRRHGPRPSYPRKHTSSPTILHTVQPNGQVIESKSQMNGTLPAANPLPTPPAQPNDHPLALTPPGRVGSPHLGQKKPRKPKNPHTARSANGDTIVSSKPTAALLDNSVPPINVLLVEDNVINLKLLEAFMKRLKVRWKSAMNGKEAVAMWRTGGFHLVLMDIQLPVMNGLEATKEIRRLEAVNSIGVFSESLVENGLKVGGKNSSLVSEADTLPDRSLFKSPVIIVALTASSLQSDRHEALAAGCNDFLTKPVNFVWMERKVTEWGCMQALIDFDGWRKWKQYAAEKAAEDPAKKAAEEKEDKAKRKAAMSAFFSRPPPTVKKDSTSTASTTPSDRSGTPVQNGTALKKVSTGGGTPNEDRKPRGHKSNRSTASTVGPTGNLESMAEVDEK